MLRIDGVVKEIKWRSTVQRKLFSKWPIRASDFPLSTWTLIAPFHEKT